MQSFFHILGLHTVRFLTPLHPPYLSLSLSPCIYIYIYTYSRVGWALYLISVKFPCKNKKERQSMKCCPELCCRLAPNSTVLSLLIKYGWFNTGLSPYKHIPCVGKPTVHILTETLGSQTLQCTKESNLYIYIERERERDKEREREREREVNRHDYKPCIFNSTHINFTVCIYLFICMHIYILMCARDRWMNK